MLTINRRTHESIYIGNDAEVKVTLLKSDCHQVTLGINAPKHIPIRREELVPINQQTYEHKSDEIINHIGAK